MRMDLALAPDVMLCLYDKVPVRIEFDEPDEPKEALAFGVEDSPDGTAGDPVVSLRSVDRSTGNVPAARSERTAARTEVSRCRSIARAYAGRRAL
jgi:hypothetical protein